MADTSRLGVYGSTVSGLSCGAGVPAGASAFGGGADSSFCGVGLDGAGFVEVVCANSEVATGSRATARAAAIRLMAGVSLSAPLCRDLVTIDPFPKQRRG